MYKKKAHIHFVGIGGIGMSGIAKILASQGYTISGCDLDLDQKSVHDLQAIGCTISQGNNTLHCADTSIDILVYSSAIKSTNHEIVAAQQRGIPTIPRALMLAELMRMKYSIAISGAHGKTTTTSLVSHILFEAHYDPTVIIGGHLTSISTNAHFGQGDFLVAEADESDKSLTKLHPTIAVITNIDREHLDVYKDLEDVKDTFKVFLSNVPFYGKAILCHDDPGIQSLMPLTYPKIITYGLTPESDIFASDIQLFNDHSRFMVNRKNADTQLGPVRISMPGIHNVFNALAAIAVACELDIPFAVISLALSTFKGVDRRFTFRGTFRGADIFDDYAHHPEEIRHALDVARKRALKKLIVLFQPHRHSRTCALWNEFIDVFSQCAIDQLVITDIYAANEPAIPGVDSQNLVHAIRAKKPSLQVQYVPLDDFTTITSVIESGIEDNDLLLLLGAGNVYKLAEKLQNTNKK